MEGIIAKDKFSTYEVGGKSDKWKKVKVRRQQLCIICGYTVKNLRPSALILGAYNDRGQLTFIGKAGSGISGEVFQKLIAQTREAQLEKAAFFRQPFANANIVWLKPQITVLVEYAEWTDDLILRSPVIKGFTKVAPEECIIN